MSYRELSSLFMEKFNEDKRKFDQKIKDIGIAKNTYLDIKYQRRDQKKKTLEAMRAYLEGRRPKYELVNPKTEFYCCDCETVMPLDRQSDRWSCHGCANISKRVSKKRHWKAYLIKRNAYKLRLKYGSFAGCMRTIIQIKKELGNEIQKQK